MSISKKLLCFSLVNKSPSEVMRKKAIKYVVKPFKKGVKQGIKQHKKYMAHRKKFEQKWLKQNQTWADTRQKKKALEKAFLKKYPQYSFYIQMERLGRKCKK